MVERLGAMGALGAGVDPEDALDTLAAVADLRFAMVLRESYGWSLDRVEDWIATTSRTLLLRDD